MLSAHTRGSWFRGIIRSILMKSLPKKHIVHQTCSYVIDKAVLDNFNHSLGNDDVTPPLIWRKAMSEFISMLVNDLPVSDACVSAFAAGIIGHRHLRKLRGI